MIKKKSKNIQNKIRQKIFKTITIRIRIKNMINNNKCKKKKYSKVKIINKHLLKKKKN